MPFAATVGLWFASVLLFGFLAEALLGSWESGRVFPFNNAHLLEEAAEGAYSPIKDPAFVSYSLVVVIVAFGLSSFWGAIGATKGQLVIVLGSVAASVALFAAHLRYAFSPNAPTAITAAALFILIAASVAGGVGIGLSRCVRAKQG